MKPLALLILAAIVAFPVAAKSTRGYVKKNGTYVAPYKSTNANKTQRDNYSSKGNTNPYTGKKGTKEPKR